MQKRILHLRTNPSFFNALTCMQEAALSSSSKLFLPGAGVGVGVFQGDSCDCEDGGGIALSTLSSK